MEVHHRWDTPSFDLDPVASGTGPFTRRALLETWWDHRGSGGDLHLVDSGEGLVPLCTWDGAVRFVGEADLTDYHSPLGAGTAQLIAEFVSGLPPGTELALDSLPRRAAEVVAAGLDLAGYAARPTRHSLSAVVSLPATYDEWLASLDRKQRHEVRRKLRRFSGQGGTPALTRLEPESAAATFATLHRKAPGEKGDFMTDEMEAFFGALVARAGAVVDVLEGPGGSIVAAAFGFEDEACYYLYNSAYEPAAAEWSPGIVLLTALVRSAIGSGRERLDFLKGGEPYKFRHGAVGRPLYEVSAVVAKPR